MKKKGKFEFNCLKIAVKLLNKMELKDSEAKYVEENFAKRCPMCGKLKLLRKFSGLQKGKLMKSSNCKKCARELSKKYYNKKKKIKQN